jgi:hypothetical protein
VSRARRMKPSTVEGRKRQAELGKIISNPRTPRAERHTAQEELDRIAPVEGSGSLQEKSILSVVPPAKPSTVDNLALVARVEAARKTGTVSRSSEMLLSAADIDAVARMELREANSAWYDIVQSQWPQTGYERTQQRGWLLNWRIGTIKGTVSEPFADYWKKCQERLNAESAFMERYKAASSTEQATLVAEKYDLTK